jgi:Protein of unknown function (DUF1580)
MHIAEDQKLHTVPEAFELLTGKRPSPPTIWRWERVGLKGVRLNTTKYGHRSMLSIAAAKEWLQAVTAASLPRTTSPKTDLTASQKQAAERLAKEVS